MKNNKKILIATPNEGGPITYSKLLLRRLPELGFRVQIVNFGPFMKYPKGIRHFFYFLSVARLALSNDLVYAMDPVSTGFPAFFAAKLTGKPFFLKIVGDYAWEQGSQRAGVTDLLDAFSTENDKYPFLVRLFKRTQFFVAVHADSIIVPSNYLKKIVTNWGVPENKITRIYNAFDAPEVSGTKEQLREKLKFSGHIVISVGRLVPWKGFDTLIKSVMPSVVKEFPDTRLLIAGEGPDREYLQKTTKEAGMEEHVTLLGKLIQKDLFEHVKASDVFVLNTSYEGLSHQLLEVLALETPIVTTSAGGNVEVIDSGVNGVLTEFNETAKMVEAISRFFRDNVWKNKIVLNGKERLKDFSEEKMLAELTKKLS